jgi:hypothetical protein
MSDNARLYKRRGRGHGPQISILRSQNAVPGRTVDTLPYFNSHSFRKTLALLGGQICKSRRSTRSRRNLGHENVLTTFSSYGDVAQHRRAEIIRGLGKSNDRAAVSPPV